MIEFSNHPVIAIIDDDFSIRFAIGKLVRSLGFGAHSFESADQYLQSPDRSETSCIVCDIQMPGKSGFDLQSYLAAQNDRTPIIFITAFPRLETRRRALDSGAVGFITKPFDNKTLIDCIELALASRRESGDSV
jgi:FixJ family two-component response regulator